MSFPMTTSCRRASDLLLRGKGSVKRSPRRNVHRASREPEARSQRAALTRRRRPCPAATVHLGDVRLNPGGVTSCRENQSSRGTGYVPRARERHNCKVTSVWLASSVLEGIGNT